LIKFIDFFYSIVGPSYTSYTSFVVTLIPVIVN